MKQENAVLWTERAVLALIFAGFSFLWAVSFTRHPVLETWLNSKVTMFGVASVITAIVALYGNKSSNDFFVKQQRWIIAYFSISYAIVMSAIGLLRHSVFQSHAFDLAIFDQAVWSLWAGKFLLSSFKGGICLLGDHMSPVLVLFAPLYLIWDNAGVLIVAQAVMTALCFFPLGLIAEEKLGKGAAPIVFAFALFFYQPLRHSIRSDFHPEFLTNPLFFMSFYCLLKNRLKLFFLGLLGLVLCKENMYGISFAFGIYLMFQRRWRPAVAILVLSLAFFYLTTQVLVPKLAGGQPYFYQANYNYLFTGNWGEHPPLVVQPLGFLEYLYKIFLPLSFLSFFDFPTLFLAAPIFFQNVLSRNPMMHSIAFQYTSGLTPAVFISTIYGMDRLNIWAGKKWNPKTCRFCLLVSILFFSLALAGKPERQHFFKYREADNGHKEIVRETLRKISPDLSVIANENLAPHLSHRLELNQFEDYERMPQKSTYPLSSDLVILDREAVTGNIGEKIRKVEASGYDVLSATDGLYLFARRGLDPKAVFSERS